MRALLSILLVALATHAEDLMPREGAGWAGFKVGTKIRMKRTMLVPKRVPSVTITTIELTESTADKLTLSMVAANAVGIEQKSTSTIPSRGEAAADEKAVTEQLKNTTVFTAGRKLECACVKTTIAGPRGKRVITEWTTLNAPRMRVKRTEENYDATGQKVVGRFSMVLLDTNASREVGNRKVACLKYSTVRTQGGYKMEGVSYVSRAVPGYEVWSDVKALKNDLVAFQVRMQVIEIRVK